MSSAVFLTFERQKKVKVKLSQTSCQDFKKHLSLFKLLLAASPFHIGDKELVLNVDIVLGLLDGGNQRPLDTELGEVLPCRPA